MVIIIEHQSTVNENMPLRLLSYIARIYEKIDNKRTYKDSLLKIPAPKFIVLYNGKASFPKEKILRLSDAFEEIDNSGLISLDLIVRMLNINRGHNTDLEGKSETLDGYAVFIAKVREYEKEYAEQDASMPARDRMSPKVSVALEEAIKSAVKYCIENGILEDYFTQKSSEVVNMLITEYNIDDAIEVAREEGMEKGIKKVQSYVLELIDRGLSGEEIKKKIEEAS